MIWPIAILLLCQLGGEILVRLLHLPLPGPVIGMVLFLAALFLVPRLAGVMQSTVQTLLGNLSLLYVPVGVGIVSQLGRIEGHVLGLAVALVVSTVAAMSAGVLVFRLVARLIGGDDARDH